MYLWRRNRPRAVYDRVAIIHGVAYNVVDEIVFKRHMAEWILPSAMAKHIKYNPRHLPVVIVDHVTTSSASLVIQEKECNLKNSTRLSDSSASCGGSASSLPSVSWE